MDECVQYTPPSSVTRHEIVDNLWDLSPGPHGRNCNAYFKYYGEQCRLALHNGGQYVFVRTHRDVIDVVQLLKQRPALSRETIIDRLRPRLPEGKLENEEEIVCNSIDLAVRLLLMVDVGSLQYGLSGQAPLRWRDGPLFDFVHARFSPPQPTGHDKRVKFDKIFNARNLGRVAGIQIIWTNNLADHLLMKDEDTRVAIFHHVSFLEHQRESAMFPPNFIDETLRTLALLFPQYDKPTKKWFGKLQKALDLDSQVIRCGQLRTEQRQIENFPCWHDRLVIFKQVFDEAEPNTLLQWWHDRRNRVQWYTFWIAVMVLGLTIFFGLVQSVEGALQVYVASHPL